MHNPFETNSVSVMFATIIVGVSLFVAYVMISAVYSKWMLLAIPLLAICRVGYYIFRGK